MTALYLTLGAALVLLAVFLAIFCWAVRSGQFDDLSTPMKRLLTEDMDESRKRK
jgi:cytochrome oxidase maturation protein, cbb3-type